MTTDPMSDPVQQRVRECLDQWVADGASPGLQCTTVNRSGACLTHAVGFADVGARTELAATTRLMAYSMSKTITAAAVLKLAAAGRLDLDDPAERYIDIPYGPAVTVRGLLSHTAGLPNPIPLRWVHLPPQHGSFDERAALRAVVTRNTSLAATPGTRFAYTNLGYWLLGAIVEVCTQQRFTDYVDRELLAPLGIGSHELGYSLVPANTASGYLEKWSWLNLLKRFVIDSAYFDRYEGSWLKIRSHYVDGPAFGGLIGTTAAFGVWLADLNGESRTLPSAARAWLFEQQHLTSGEPVPMTLGWHIGELDGSRYYFKEGGGGGFHSMMRLHPERGFGSIIIGNATGFRASKALDEIDRLLF